MTIMTIIEYLKKQQRLKVDLSTKDGKLYRMPAIEIDGKYYHIAYHIDEAGEFEAPEIYVQDSPTSASVAVDAQNRTGEALFAKYSEKTDRIIRHKNAIEHSPTTLEMLKNFEALAEEFDPHHKKKLLEQPQNLIRNFLLSYVKLPVVEVEIDGEAVRVRPRLHIPAIEDGKATRRFSLAPEGGETELELTPDLLTKFKTAFVRKTAETLQGDFSTPMLEPQNLVEARERHKSAAREWESRTSAVEEIVEEIFELNEEQRRRGLFSQMPKPEVRIILAHDLPTMLDEFERSEVTTFVDPVAASENLFRQKRVLKEYSARISELIREFNSETPDLEKIDEGLKELESLERTVELQELKEVSRTLMYDVAGKGRSIITHSMADVASRAMKSVKTLHMARAGIVTSDIRSAKIRTDEVARQQDGDGKLLDLFDQERYVRYMPDVAGEEKIILGQYAGLLKTFETGIVADREAMLKHATNSKLPLPNLEEAPMRALRFMAKSVESLHGNEETEYLVAELEKRHAYLQKTHDQMRVVCHRQREEVIIQKETADIAETGASRFLGRISIFAGKFCAAISHGAEAIGFTAMATNFSGMSKNFFGHAGAIARTAGSRNMAQEAMRLARRNENIRTLTLTPDTTGEDDAISRTPPDRARRIIIELATTTETLKQEESAFIRRRIEGITAAIARDDALTSQLFTNSRQIPGYYDLGANLRNSNHHLTFKGSESGEIADIRLFEKDGVEIPLFDKKGIMADDTRKIINGILTRGERLVKESQRKERAGTAAREDVKVEIDYPDTSPAEAKENFIRDKNKASLDALARAMVRKAGGIGRLGGEALSGGKIKMPAIDIGDNQFYLVLKVGEGGKAEVEELHGGEKKGLRRFTRSDKRELFDGVAVKDEHVESVASLLETYGEVKTGTRHTDTPPPTCKPSGFSRLMRTIGPRIR